MSINVKIYGQNAEPAGEMELSPKVFGVKANKTLIYQAVTAQTANQRKAIAHTKDRSEVRGGGRKPWKQKGTGRARHGSSRSPIWIGGGVTFGPRNDRNFKKKINNKMRQAALLMVLSDKAANGNIVILDKLDMPEFKTKIFNQIMSGIESKILNGRKACQRSFLIIVGHADEKLSSSAKNLPGIKVINACNINIIDLLKFKDLILSKEAVEKLTGIYGK